VRTSYQQQLGRLRHLLIIFAGVLLLTWSTACSVTDYEKPRGWASFDLPDLDWTDLQVQGHFLYAIASDQGAFRLDLDNQSNGWANLIVSQSDFEEADIHPDNLGLNAIAHFPSNPDVLITSVGTSRSPRVFISSNSGSSWRVVEDLSYTTTSDDAAYRGVVFLTAVGDSLIGISPEYRLSFDEEGNWNLTLFNGTEPLALVYAQNLDDRSVIWAGRPVPHFHVYVSVSTAYSVDGGITWTKTNNAMPRPPRHGVRTIALKDSNQDYVAVGITGEPQYLYATADRGVSWTSIEPAEDCCEFVTSNHVGEHRLWASQGDSLFVSSDFGQVWESVTPPLESTESIIALSHSESDQDLYLLTPEKVLVYRY
jgi:hypothetical protein